jgi:hypothetical protein
VILGDINDTRLSAIIHCGGKARSEVIRWYQNDKPEALGGLKTPGLASPSTQKLYETVDSLKNAVNRQNFVLQVLVKKHPGILDEMI